jgi:transposase
LNRTYSQRSWRTLQLCYRCTTIDSGANSGFPALSDTCGFLVFILVHAVDIHDRDGAVDVLKRVCSRFPWRRFVFADGGYAGDKLKDALAPMGKWTLEITKRSDTAKRFELLPRRWVVERKVGKGLGNIHHLIDRLGTDHLDPDDCLQNRKLMLCLINF